MRLRTLFATLCLAALGRLRSAPRPRAVRSAHLGRDAAARHPHPVQRRIPGPRARARSARSGRSPSCREEFRRAGLQPGNHGSWFQDVPLVEITATGNPALHITGGQRRRPQFRLPHRLYRRLLPRPAARRGRQQRRRLRRLRDQRAGARLERLCRPRRARQDGDHPGQRSRLADRRACRARSTAGR